MSAVSAEGKVSSWVTDSTKAVFRRWYWDREESGEYNRPEFGSGILTSAWSMRRLSRWKSQGGEEARGWKERRPGAGGCLLATGRASTGAFRYVEVRWLRRDG